MKKVLMIAGSLPPIRCGVGYYSQRLCRELAKERVDFEILSTQGVNTDTPAPLMTVPNWRIHTIPRMVSAISKSGAGIIHIQNPAVGYQRQLGINLLPYVLRILKPGLKVAITLHEYHGSRWQGRYRNLITIAAAHKITVSNEADKAALPKWLGRKTVIVPIGSNLEMAAKNHQVYESLMTKGRLDPKKPTLLFFGFAYPAKGLEALLGAMTVTYLSGWQLLLLTGLDAKDNYQAGLLNQVKDINRVRPRVLATGFLPDNEVSAVLQEGRYFVLPQATPLSAKSSTAIAAVCSGIVLISKGLPNAVDIAPFEHLKNSYLLDDVTPQTIAKAVQRLEDSPDEVKNILDGAAKLKDYFSWPHIVSEHKKIYEEL